MPPPLFASHRPIVFVHFPKAGGSSLFTQLKGLFPGEYHEDYNHDPLGPAGGESVCEPPQGTKLIFGHFRAARYDAVPGRFLFTFLRWPVKNLLSIYCFWLSVAPHGNPWHDKFLAERPDIIAFARYAPIQKLSSETYFGGFNLRKFNFIGFHETRAESIVTLNSMTGLNVSNSIHENRTPNFDLFYNKISAIPEIFPRLEILLADDIELYRRARYLFPSAHS